MKVDFKKEYKEFYSQRKNSISIVTVPSFCYATVQGIGSPELTDDFKNAIEALYNLSYAIKFESKINLQKDYVVMPLEGQWWADNMNDFINQNRENWRWSLAILQPHFISTELLEQKKQELILKKGLPALNKIQFTKIEDGLCAQIMHVGSYENEAETVASLHNYIQEQGGQLRGKHREIYLSDIRRCAPERLKTIIRQGFSM